MLKPVQVLEKLTVDEFIGLCQQVPGKFEVVEIERDENLDPTVFVELPNRTMQVIQVKSWQNLTQHLSI